MTNPFAWFDDIKMINLDNRTDRWATMMQRFSKLGIHKLVSHFPAIETPQNHHIGCALSHRAVIEDARKRGLNNVFVFEDDVVFDRDLMSIFPTVVDEIKDMEWDMLFLGGHVWGKTYDFVPHSNTLRACEVITCTHAIAYNACVFDQLLDEIPHTYEGMEDWLKIHRGIDQFYAWSNFRKLLTNPMLATQIELFDQPGMRDRSAFDI